MEADQTWPLTARRERDEMDCEKGVEGDGKSVEEGGRADDTGWIERERERGKMMK